MNKSAILQVFYGFRGSPDDVKITEIEKEHLSTVVDMLEELEKKLSPEQNELLNKLLDAHADMSCESADNHYREGFKLGLLIGIECMEE